MSQVGQNSTKMVITLHLLMLLAKIELHLNVQKPSSIDHQNACYNNGWLHATLITGVLCFGVDTLIWGKHNCVGSWNDGDMVPGTMALSQIQHYQFVKH